MTTTDEEGRPCLHCAINDVISQWHEKHAERRGEVYVVDVIHVLDSLANVAVDTIVNLKKPEQRTEAVLQLHSALDAFLVEAATGVPQEVTLPTRQ